MIALIARLAFQLLVLYVFVVVLVYINQRSMQYFPNKSFPGDPKDNGVPEMSAITITTDDGLQLLAWFAPPENKNGKIVVYFHGNGGHIGHRQVKARYFIESGYGLMFVEYRGYGGNPGRPSEQGLYKDARAALKWLDDEGYSPAQFVYYGESIGTGVAVQMAHENQPRYMILEAPFSSAADVAKKSYFFLPVDWLMKDRFDNIDKIANVTSSLLIVHGDEDAVIPQRLAKNLYERANHPKEFVSINGGNHNDLYEHHAGFIILEWLEKHVKAEKAADIEEPKEAATGTDE
jgi:uncharacterized protein